MVSHEMPGELVTVERVDVRLHALGFGGAGPTVVLLHGLAGHAGEWQPIVNAIDGQCRVIAIDQRGHGRSTRIPVDMSRTAHADDVVALIDRTTPRGRVTLVGQSLGGHTAMLVAARYPDLIDRLVMIEASPGGPDRTAPHDVRRWLESWPVPFGSHADAVAFFGGGTPGRAWADGLHVGEDGLRPRFDVAAIVRSLDEIASRSWWGEWDAVRCPTMVIRGTHGWITDHDAAGMAGTGPCADIVEVTDAGHDVHLDQPAQTAQLIVAHAITSRDT
ncbi:alpha/beta hydrolase [soil metagenome]